MHYRRQAKSVLWLLFGFYLTSRVIVIGEVLGFLWKLRKVSRWVLQSDFLRDKERELGEKGRELPARVH